MTHSTLKVVDLSLLNGYVKHNPAKLKKLIETFLRKSAADLKTLDSALESGEYELWRLTAHGLKGSSSFIGAEKLKAVCEDIEGDTNATDSGRKEFMSMLRGEYHQVCITLQKELEKINVTGTGQ